MIAPKTSFLVSAGAISLLVLAGSIYLLARTLARLPDPPPEPPPPTAAERAKHAEALVLERQERMRKQLVDEFTERARRDGTVPAPQKPLANVWEQKLWETDDFNVFFFEANSAAKEGDADAAFAAYLALDWCGNRRRAKATDARYHARCDRIWQLHQNFDLIKGQFLDQAVASGMPRAVALQVMYEIEMAPFLGARGKPGPEREEWLRGVKIRLLQVLNTSDADATWAVADVVRKLYADDPRAEAALWVWRLAACDQGFYCEESARWMRELCEPDNDCVAGESGRSYIRRKAGDFSSLYARARDLAITMRAGTLTLQAFDDSVTTLPLPGQRDARWTNVERR